MVHQPELKELIVLILDQPINLAEVSYLLNAGKTCIADIYGYRNDLIVKGVGWEEHALPQSVIGLTEFPLLLTLQAPDGPLFKTHVKYVHSVTVR